MPKASEATPQPKATSIKKEHVFRTNKDGTNIIDIKNKKENTAYVTTETDDTPDDFSPNNDAMPILSIMESKQKLDAKIKKAAAAVPGKTVINEHGEIISPMPSTTGEAKTTTQGQDEIIPKTFEPINSEMDDKIKTVDQKPELDKLVSSSSNSRKGYRGWRVVPAAIGTLVTIGAGMFFHGHKEPDVRATVPPTQPPVGRPMPETPTSFNTPLVEETPKPFEPTTEPQDIKPAPMGDAGLKDPNFTPSPTTGSK